MYKSLHCIIQLVMKLKWRVRQSFLLLFDYSSCVHCAAAAAPFAVIFTLALLAHFFCSHTCSQCNMYTLCDNSTMQERINEAHTRLRDAFSGEE